MGTDDGTGATDDQELAALLVALGAEVARLVASIDDLRAAVTIAVELAGRDAPPTD